jgi:hypothetical protein
LRTADKAPTFAPHQPGLPHENQSYRSRGRGRRAEVPAIPGCATEGETVEDLMANLHEAIEGCLAVDVESP